jgi:hypothetical protein
MSTATSVGDMASIDPAFGRTGWFAIAGEIRNSSETNYGLGLDEHNARLQAMEEIMLMPNPESGLQVSMLEVFCRVFKETGYLHNNWRSLQLLLEKLLDKHQHETPHKKWLIVITKWLEIAKSRKNSTVLKDIETLEERYAQMGIERSEVPDGSQMGGTTTVPLSATSANELTFAEDTLTVSSWAGAPTHHVSSALMKVHCRQSSSLLRLCQPPSPPRSEAFLRDMTQPIRGMLQTPAFSLYRKSLETIPL